MTAKTLKPKRWFPAFIIVSALLLSCAQAPYTYRVPQKAGDGWATASLGEVGVDSKKISLLIQDVRNQKFKDIDSVVLVKDGKLVLDEYFGRYGPDTLHEIHSVSKSITSILIGIAVDKRMIVDIDAKVYSFFPEYKGTRWIDEKYDISVKHLLMMAAGIDWDEYSRPLDDPKNDVRAMLNSEDWMRYVLNKRLVDPPGRQCRYGGGQALLLGGILKKASGMYADKFADKYLFGPLGIVHYFWHRHKDGTINTQGGLAMKPRDMAKIGYLMLRDGRWNGRRIVSRKWVAESTSAHIKKGMGDYGYLWYPGGGIVNGREFTAFWAWGRGGQLIFVFPSLDLVAVFTSNPYDNEPGLYRPFTMLGDYILPAMLPAPKRSIKPALTPALMDQYVGKYTWDEKRNSVVEIFRRGNVLYSSTPTGEVLKLTPESEDVFRGSSKDINDFTVVIKRDGTGGVKEAILYCFPFVKKRLKKIA